MSQPLFIDDPELRQALDEAAQRAIERLAEVLPEIEDASAAPLRRQLRAHLAALVSGKPGTAEQPERLPHLALGDDTFGEARDAAKAWLKTSWQPDGREIPLAVVPAYFDDLMGRHVLIYGVLTR